MREATHTERNHEVSEREREREKIALYWSAS